MRIVSVGESVAGANVRFVHEGKEYLAFGATRGEVMARIDDAFTHGEDLAEAFIAKVDPPQGPEPVLPESEPAPKKGAKSRG